MTEDCEHKQLEPIYGPGLFGILKALRCVKCKKEWVRNTYFVAKEPKSSKS